MFAFFYRLLQWLVLCVLILFVHSVCWAKSPALTIHLPFPHGSKWRVAQGNHGFLSHRYQPVYYGYDFDRKSDQWAVSNLAYEHVVVSPVAGQIVYVSNDFLDFQKGLGCDGTFDVPPASAMTPSDYGHHLGNQIVIETDDKHYVRLGGLRRDTISLQVDQYVKIGDVLGEVGCTGDYPLPALHMQVEEQYGGNSIPFAFAEGPVYQGEWYVSGNPGTGGWGIGSTTVASDVGVADASSAAADVFTSRDTMALKMISSDAHSFGSAKPSDVGTNSMRVEGDVSAGGCQSVGNMSGRGHWKFLLVMFVFFIAFHDIWGMRRTW